MKLLDRLLVAPILCVLACSRGEGQGGLTLEAKLPRTFAQLSNVVELSDGRVVFADTKQKLFFRADLKSGELDTLGKRVDSLGRNAPASHYKFPGWVAHLGGDTIALVDFSAQRTTLWNEKGEPLQVLRIGSVSGDAPVLLYDTLGHGYKVDYQAVIGGGEPGRTFRPDSIPVLRIGLKGGAVDTVANLAAPEYGDATFGEQIQEAAKVFAPTDLFGVLPNGTAWVARGKENRVDWRAADGSWTVGQSHEYKKVPVTQQDRDRVLAQVREHGKSFGMPQNMRVEYPFAETKPPFELALGRPNGEVWLQRPRGKVDDPLTYDVFNEKGVWQREVAFPRGASLAGFGASGGIYATIKTGEGERTVGRYRLK